LNKHIGKYKKEYIHKFLLFLLNLSLIAKKTARKIPSNKNPPAGITKKGREGIERGIPAKEADPKISLKKAKIKRARKKRRLQKRSSRTDNNQWFLKEKTLACVKIMQFMAIKGTKIPRF